ncbi:MAG TPA: hypothetical protein VK651_00650, partial [Blastocatellia bacterium]|nr:hypothetical protein [Blastocatellia bacterium]
MSYDSIKLRPQRAQNLAAAGNSAWQLGQVTPAVGCCWTDPVGACCCGAVEGGAALVGGWYT